MISVKQREFSRTLLAYHPGVMTMWIAGLRTFFTELDIDVENLIHSRWFIGIVVWAGIGVASLLLYKLLGQWVALTGFVCLAYSPLFLAQARRVHTDALAATFILLTVLLFLFYCQHRKHLYLVLSGATFGFALLSKSYALILLLWIPLCLFLFRNPEKSARCFLTWVAEMICFSNCAFFIILVLWPIFWTPLFGLMAACLMTLTIVLLKDFKWRNGNGKKGDCQTSRNTLLVVAAGIGLGLVSVGLIPNIWRVFDRLKWAVTTPHEVEHFFFGKIVNDPGWFFYPFVLTIKSTPLMLPLALAGGILLGKHRKYSEETSKQFRISLALVASVVLFSVCLSGASKKFSRYLLPAFLMLEILSAIGFVEGLKWSYNALRTHLGTEEIEKYKQTGTAMACIGFFIIQILPVLTLHPYYGTYYNLCWKLTDITKIITVGEASGLDIAAKYLSDKPDVRKLTVQVSPLATEFVNHYFQGRVYRADRKTKHSPDYEVVYIRDSQIGGVPQTGTFNGELEAVVTLNGIDHVWIYRVQ